MYCRKAKAEGRTLRAGEFFFPVVLLNVDANCDDVFNADPLPVTGMYLESYEVSFPFSYHCCICTNPPCNSKCMIYCFGLWLDTKRI